MTPTPWAMDAARALVPLPGFVIGLSDLARGLADAVGGPFDNTTGAADAVERGVHTDRSDP